MIRRRRRRRRRRYLSRITAAVSEKKTAINEGPAVKN